MTAIWAIRGAAIAVFSASICVGLILVLQPLLQRYALVKPTARSSHREPTPQGAGIAVIAATLAATVFGTFVLDGSFVGPSLTVFAAVVAMACIGAADDFHPLAVLPRLILQALLVAAIIHALPDDLRVFPALPWWSERALLLVGGLWFVNLVNFMDGIDLMTVAEVVPITVTLASLGIFGALSREGVAAALALGGAICGFAYFNRPTAKLFLGDVGSLPIGLLLGFLLILLAGHGELAAALLLPLYYLADSTLTLLRRLFGGERVWQAHHTHYYQRAADRGLTTKTIVSRVFAVNLVLAALALLTATAKHLAVDIAALACGATLVGFLLCAFARGRR